MIMMIGRGNTETRAIPRVMTFFLEAFVDHKPLWTENILNLFRREELFEDAKYPNILLFRFAFPKHRLNTKPRTEKQFLKGGERTNFQINSCY